MAGVLVGVAVAWVAWGGGHSHAGAVEPSNRVQEQALLAAVRRSERATFTVEGSFRRTTDDGKHVVRLTLFIRVRPAR